MKSAISAVAAIVLLGISAVAYAQSGHQGHGTPKAAQKSGSASTKAYRAANAKMHTDMAIKFSGDADVDFVRGMIPHHQGAIDMAKVLLAHGKDETLRKLAMDIIQAQEREIAEMREWLKRQGK
jgi:uncharacterized protein (DUF305 family)